MSTGPSSTAAARRGAEVDLLIDELRARLAELPTIYAARANPAAGPRQDRAGRDRAGRAAAFPLRRAITLGRTVGILGGAGVFRALSAHL